MNLAKKVGLLFAGGATAVLAAAGTALGADDFTVTTSSSGSAVGGMFGLICGLLISLVALVLVIWIAVWIYRDATKRGAPAVLWVLLWLFFSWLALIIYLVVRPKEFVATGQAATPPPPPPPVEPGAGA
jgi:hypothetical protein